MIRYTPITRSDELHSIFNFTEEKDAVYGGYIGYDDSSTNVGKSLVMLHEYSCELVKLECDFSDKLLTEGFVRASLNFAANRGCYMAYCGLDGFEDVLFTLGFSKNDNVFSGDIPTLLGGCCGCRK